MVHGMTRDMNDYVIKYGADFFARDYDVYRFNLYGGQDGARDILECTLADHADDINAVLTHFAGSYDKAFVIGHSYGGPSVMLANPKNITAVSLWEPTFDLKKWQDEYKNVFHEKDDSFVVGAGVYTLIGKPLYASARKLDDAACSKLAKEFTCPVQVVLGGESVLANMPHSYHSFNRHKGSHQVVIPNAGHCFTEGKTADILLEKTQAWFATFK